MNYYEFCDTFWDYYLILENDFLGTERYLYFDLGNNALYSENVSCEDYGNSLAYSVEYIKQYQAICSEVDVVLEAICKELGKNMAENMGQYTKILLNEDKWKNIVCQKVKMRNVVLQPFEGWGLKREEKIRWWEPYNGVKHHRNERLREANLKNVVNALAGLFILENYLAKYIGDRDDECDVPNDISSLFTMVEWETRDNVLGKNLFNGRNDSGVNFFFEGAQDMEG